jgi:hypothetical protein
VRFAEMPEVQRTNDAGIEKCEVKMEEKRGRALIRRRSDNAGKGKEAVPCREETGQDQGEWVG